MIDQIEALVVHTEAEALLAEQNFIKQYKPRFNIRLRDDKSYPYIAISLDEDFPRVYFTRERHRRDRAYFGPYSNAKRVRSTLEVLGKVFMFRSCEGPTPGRRSGSPCLDYYIKRCEAPCVGYVTPRGVPARDRRRDRLPLRPLPRDRARAGGLDARAPPTSSASRTRRASATGCAPCARCSSASASPRGRARSTRSRWPSPTSEANAQVFQVRDGVLSDRQSFYLDNAAGGGVADVAEAFILQYYASAMMVPPLLVVQRELGDAPALAEALSAAARRAGRDSRRPSAATSGGSSSWPSATRALALDQEKLRSERRRQQRVEALDGLQQALGLDTIPLRIECFDISTLMGTNTVASMVVFEGGAPKKSDYRRFKMRFARPARGRADRGARRLRGDGGGARPADAPRWRRQRDVSPARQGVRPELRRAAERGRDRRWQGPARRRAARAPGVPRARRARDLAGQADRGGVHPRPRRRRCCSPTTRPSFSCSSACATRPTGSRSPTTGSSARPRR